MSPLPDHVAAKIDARGICWLWRGRIHEGYGYTSVGNRPARVHRLVYERLVGTIPTGLDLDHLCRVRSCCNPDHLEPVTRAENIRRSPLVRRPRSRRTTHCRHGHEFTAENTYVRPDDGRTCRECNRASAERTQAVRLARRSRMIDLTEVPS